MNRCLCKCRILETTRFLNRWSLALFTLVLCFESFSADFVSGQTKFHRLHNAYQPTGAVAQNQLQRHAGFQGYIQPVEFRAPEGARVAIAIGGVFEDWESNLKAGLMVGSVYRLKVSNIPENLASEVYPTIEIINRLHPPEGKENRFPIPVHITKRDLEHALAGRFVVRVVYLENPRNANPEPQDPNDQHTITALAEEDPLHLADQLGRPMAILRMGSRVPDTNGISEDFVFGSPPVTLLSSTTPSNQNTVPVATSDPLETRQSVAVETELQSTIPQAPNRPPGIGITQLDATDRNSEKK